MGRCVDSQGEDWEEGFASGLRRSLCFFPLLSYGSTAPLAALPPDPESALAAGWDERPAGRPRLRGEADDPEDNVLKEFLIAVALLEGRAAAEAEVACAEGVGAGTPGSGRPRGCAEGEAGEEEEEAEGGCGQLQVRCLQSLM